MNSKTRYFLLRDEISNDVRLGKIVWRDEGLFGYLLSDSQWRESRLMFECLWDGLLGEEIEESEAAAIAERLGASLDRCD